MEEWPNFLSDIKNYCPESGDYIIVSEVSTIDNCEHILTPALISQEELEKLDASKIGVMVYGSGPHPSPDTETYEPKFWIDAPKGINLEPLVLQWESNNKTILWPDQGFLMTYGQFPRLIAKKEEIVWDEPAKPINDVILVNPISKHHWGNANLAQVKIRKEFIEDYSSIRHKIIIQIYYEIIRLPLDDEIKKYMNNGDYIEEKFKTHTIRITNDFRDKNFVRIEVCGYKELANPGKSPITKGRWEYGELNWPGFNKPVTNDYSRTLRPMDLVYVSDSVLEKFEGHEDYEIHPESGSVSYGNQWSVSFCHRVGRNYIALELKKLYEGNRPEIVKHWHKYAVDLKGIDRTKENIVDLARQLVDSYLMFGEYLAKIFASVLGCSVDVKDVIKFDKRQLEYYGWWSIKEIERITWHISKNFNKETFLERCKRLNILIIEGLNESLLRQTLIKIGVERDKIKEFGNLKLLELLVEIVIISSKSGLNIVKEGNEIIKRIDDKNINNILTRLFGLYYLRQQAAHYEGKGGKKEFLTALESFGIESPTTSNGFVDAIEIIYKGIFESLSELNKIISKT